ncbi:MAG: tagaturonate reductase [Bacteroidota bacterium]
MRVLQFGGGNFIRAFVGPAVAALNELEGFDASITIVKPTERGDYEALRVQNGRYHLLVKGFLDGQVVDEVQCIDVVDRVIQPYSAWDDFLATAADPSYRIVTSNTTESGIRFVPENLVAGVCPKEFPAKLCAWLYARWRAIPDSDPLYVLPCELLPDNGDELKKCVRAYSAHWSLPSAFLSWLEEACIFVNSLVDRIVSGRPDPVETAWDRIGERDELVAVAEPYLLWAIEDVTGLQELFPLHRTNFHAIFTKELDRYRRMKVRILNGSHILMVYTGIPAGIQTVAEYVDQPEWGAWLRRVLQEEILPVLPYPKEELDEYAKQVWDRFRNPFLHHKLADIALNKHDKWEVRIIPTVEDYYTEFGQGPPLIGKLDLSALGD